MIDLIEVAKYRIGLEFRNLGIAPGYDEDRSFCKAIFVLAPQIVDFFYCTKWFLAPSNWKKIKLVLNKLLMVIQFD